MSAIKDIYDVIKDLKNLADEYQNHEMAEKVIEIQNSYFNYREEIQKLKDENRSLKDIIARMHNNEELEKDLELTEQGFYIRLSEKEQGKNIMYCPACWQNEHKLMPLVSPQGYRYRCSNCNAHIIDNGDFSFQTYAN